MSQRTEQVESVIQQQLGEIFSRELEMPEDHLVTISRVEVTPDLETAKVYISILPFDAGEEIMGLIDNQRAQMQKLLHEQLTMKTSPKLEFIQDTQPEKASEIERLIDEEVSFLD